MRLILESLPHTLDAEGIAKILYKSVKTILRDISRRPHKLPPFTKVGNKAIWVTSDVFQWLGCSCVEMNIKTNNPPTLKSLSESLLDAAENNKKNDKKKSK